MNLIVSFLPFLVFAVGLHLGYVALALWGAAIVAAVLLVRDVAINHKSAKILEVGTLVLFLALALYTSLSGRDWTIPDIRLIIDGGLFAIAAGSLAIGRPFTLQYAREGAPASIWHSPAFLAVNRRITLVWCAAFLVMVATDAAMIWLPQIPQRLDIVATILALVAAVRYTKHAAGSAAN